MELFWPCVKVVSSAGSERPYQRLEAFICLRLSGSELKVDRRDSGLGVECGLVD